MLARVALGSVGLLLVQCGGGASDATGDNAPDAGAPGNTAPDSSMGLRGTLVADDGAAIADHPVLACMATACLLGQSGSEGQFWFSIESPADVALKTLEDLDSKPRRGALLMPVHITGSRLVDVGDVGVPTLPDGVPFAPKSAGPTVYEAGDGLILTLVRGDLTPRLGDFLRDVAARRIPLTEIRPMAGLEGERIDAVYALHPFAAVSASPIAVEAEADLPSGTAVNFRSISEIDGRLSEPVPGRADGAFVRTDPGTGLSELTWLVISHSGAA
jgi:hypothetical protein